MFPILYKRNETNFTHNGLGLLKDSIKAVAIEELNGMFELNIEYDSEGFLVDEIKEEMIIKAKRMISKTSNYSAFTQSLKTTKTTI